MATSQNTWQRHNKKISWLPYIFSPDLALISSLINGHNRQADGQIHSNWLPQPEAEKTYSVVIVHATDGSVKLNAATKAFHLYSSLNAPWERKKKQNIGGHTERAQSGIFLPFYSIWVTLTYDRQNSALLWDICVGWWRCEGKSGPMLGLILIWPDFSGLYPSHIYLAHLEIFIRTSSLRTELLEKSQWLFLIGSSCLVVIHPPTHGASEGRKSRGVVLCFTEPLGAVLYRIYLSLQFSTVRQSLEYTCRASDFDRVKPENIAVSLVFHTQTSMLSVFKHRKPNVGKCCCL